MSLEDLLAAIEEDIGESDKALAKEIAGDLAALMAKKATGSDVDGELAHIKASAANLSAGTAAKMSHTFSEWAQNIVGALLTKALG